MLVCLLTVADVERIAWDSLVVTAIDGQAVSLDAPSTKATVFVFVTNSCPIANAYQPRLRQLQREYGRQGIQMVQVYPIPGIASDTILAHRQAFEINAISVADPTRELAKKLGAKITPEAVVVDRTGKVVYRGRIDNQHAALGKKRPEATEHNLADALQAIVADQPIAVSQTAAVGCVIRY